MLKLVFLNQQIAEIVGIVFLKCISEKFWNYRKNAKINFLKSSLTNAEISKKIVKLVSENHLFKLAEIVSLKCWN